MNKMFIAIACFFWMQSVQSQGTQRPDKDGDKTYRSSPPRINDLVHTKLDVSFDYDKSYLYGKAWITLKPHFYPTDSLTLDAKGMDIKKITLGNSILKYKYDGLELKINLDKQYKRADNYTIYIEYTSKPDELQSGGSAAITSDKGLYFINPKGTEQGKPIQIWTQGETQSNSVWMPTIDRPNQKSTEEISMTVPDKYVTLSNGLLISQKKNPNGTRTDNWKMDLPHAPYLFFMGVGDFAIVKDKYKSMEVNYYVEKQYEPVAKKIFGNTPEMIGFYEKILGVPYAWPKYSQIVGRDYVSGAMENTTATLHQESAYQNARQLVDGNGWEETIAHELFHQWFGDLVTAESWSNLTVNESFANYSEYLWDEYKYGKDVADAHNEEDMTGYLRGGNEKKDLVRFRYNDREDMFDAVSYNKGGRILHMLRNYVGDSAFFKSLNNYLTTNKFKTGEAAQLRLAFEEVTGKDLNWYWNQWYYGNGHPKLKIDYQYNDSIGKVQVRIEQTQKTDKVFVLPLAIDIYEAGKKTRQQLWISNKTDSFSFDYSKRPDLINVDADKILLCEKTDNKSTENFIYQYNHAGNYMDRKEALDYFKKKGLKEITLGLTDPFAGLRIKSIENLFDSKYATDEAVVKTLETIAATDKDKKTQAAALGFLGGLTNKKYEPLFTKYVNDSSYSVAAAALGGIVGLDPSKAHDLAIKYSTDAKGDLGEIVQAILYSTGSEADFDMLSKLYNDGAFGQEKIQATTQFIGYLVKVNDETLLKKGIDQVLGFRKSIPAQYKSFIDGMVKKNLEKLAKAKSTAISDYITEGLKK